MFLIHCRDLLDQHFSSKSLFDDRRRQILSHFAHYFFRNYQKHQKGVVKRRKSRYSAYIREIQHKN